MIYTPTMIKNTISFISAFYTLPLICISCHTDLRPNSINVNEHTRHPLNFIYETLSTYYYRLLKRICLQSKYYCRQVFWSVCRDDCSSLAIQ